MKKANLIIIALSLLVLVTSNTFGQESQRRRTGIKPKVTKTINNKRTIQRKTTMWADHPLADDVPYVRNKQISKSKVVAKRTGSWRAGQDIVGERRRKPTRKHRVKSKLTNIKPN